MFVLSHGIATLCRNFELTFFVAMFLYFVIMILSGMMGITYENLPKGMRGVAKLIPITYVNKDFIKVWKGESYQFGPFVQAFFFTFAVSILILALAVKREERTLQG